MTIREAVAEGSRILASAGIESYSLDASLLLAEILNISRPLLFASAPDPIKEESFLAFNDFLNKRISGECVAYILGRKEFYGLDFLVNPSVLVPRPETETLVEIALKEIGNESETERHRVLDLCTGSGAVAIALKFQVSELKVWAADISSEALETAKTNAKRLLPHESIHFLRGDLFKACQPPIPDLLSLNSLLFSVIVSNPPYVPATEIATLSPEVRSEPVIALDGGNDGLDIIRRIIAEAPKFLCRRGTLILEADPRQMSEIACLLEQNGFSDIHVFKDLSGRERVILGRT